MPYFVPSSPSSNEHSTYHRAPIVFFWTTPQVAWTWRFSTDMATPTGALARMTVDGEPVTDWIAPDAKGLFAFSFVAKDGHHIAKPQLQNAFAEVLAKPFLVNTTGKPLLGQKPWAATTRFDRRYANMTNMAAQVEYPGALPVPKAYPLKAREVPHYREVLAKNDLWVTHPQQNISAALTRRFTELPTGDIAIEEDQKYFYGDSTSLGNPQIGLNTPTQTLHDGGRGIGNLGFVYKIIVRSGGNGVYFTETNGRLGLMKWDGGVITELGWRIKPGELKAHGGLRSVHYQYRTNKDHQAFFDSKWEYFGDWSQVPGSIHRMHEPWGFCVASRRPDGTINRRDGHEFWLCDTLNHRILFADHWTAHSQQGFQPAHFPPVGYKQATGPTGQTTVFLWGGNSDATPSEFFNEPWDCEVGPDGKLYWTNFGNGTICRANLDGTNPEVVLRSPVVPSNAQLGIGQRLGLSQFELVNLRAQFHMDGPVGVATCIRPQAMGFTSAGELVWIERYTYALKALNLQTMIVRTVGLIPKVEAGSTSASTNDFAMSIDVEGTCGPVDDIFLNGWHNSDHRFGIDGTYRGRPLWTSGAVMRGGPLNLCESPGYAWGIGVGNGSIVGVGNAAGSQMVRVTKRLPTDQTPDLAKWKAGRAAYNSVSSMALTHGPDLQGELGAPTAEVMGAWSTDQVKTYAAGFGVSELDAFVHYVSVESMQYDYSGATPADTTAPSAPRFPLTFTQGDSMYVLKLAGVAGPESDIVKARVYVEGVPMDVDVQPGQPFEVTAPAAAGASEVAVEYSFVDGSGNESGKYAQTIALPDVQPPAAPVEGLKVVSIVWA